MINYKDLNLTEEELDELQEQLNNRKKKTIYEDNLAAIEENKKYVGKCYKDGDKYIRVISAKSSNQYRLECMCFKFPIEYHENHRMTKIFNPDNAFSTIDFDGIYVEDYPLLCSAFAALGHKNKGKVINNLIEITEEEYFNKMIEYIVELNQKMKEGFFDTTVSYLDRYSDKKSETKDETKNMQKFINNLQEDIKNGKFGRIVENKNED